MSAKWIIMHNRQLVITRKVHVVIVNSRLRKRKFLFKKGYPENYPGAVLLSMSEYISSIKHWSWTTGNRIFESNLQL